MKSGSVQRSSGEIYDLFSIIAFDERKDIAIIQIAGFDLEVVELGNSGLEGTWAWHFGRHQNTDRRDPRLSRDGALD